MITSSGELYPNHQGNKIVTLTLWNRTSFNLPGLATADKHSPEYLGRMVPIIYYEPYIANTQNDPNPGQPNSALYTLARRLYTQTCLAQKWMQFQAPNVLITDPADAKQMRPRPLRLYDPIQVYDPKQKQWLNCVVRSAVLDYRSDRKQMVQVDAVATVDANPGMIMTL